jgi:hypothetical protein
MLKSFIFSSVIFLAALHAYSQVNQEWVARYSGAGNNEITAIAVDEAGNVFVTGASWENGSFDDYATIKYSPAGVQQWVQRYDGPANNWDIATAIALDDFGNVFITGTSHNISGNDFATIKYNTYGVRLWVQRYRGPGNGDNGATSIITDHSGNVYVTGYSMGSGSGYDYATIKYNTNGVQQWVQRYNGTGNSYDYVHALTIDVFGNTYITGSSLGNGGDNDYATIKYDTYGIQKWVKRYNGSGNGNDNAAAIAIDAFGNVFITGWSTGPDGYHDFATIKYGQSGDQQWVQRYHGPGNGNDEAVAIAVDISDNAIVTGYSRGNGTDYDYTTIQYNIVGTQQWVQRYNGPKDSSDFATALVVDGPGNVYVTGYSMGAGTFYDFATVKYNINGVQLWVQRYNGPANDYDMQNVITRDGIGNLYVAGWSTGFGGYDEYATIKYSQPIGIQPVSSEIPDHFSLSQNYPNPFNPTTKIKFDVASPLRTKGARLPLSGGESEGVKIIIFDILGREIATLVNEQLKSGRYEVQWDASNFPSGVYFYSLSAGNYKETKKMILIK